MDNDFLQPRYLNAASMKTYLENGKVEFSDEVSQGLPDNIFGELIAFGEAAVEHDFSPYFKIPLQGINGGSWLSLPPSTIAAIKKMLVNRATLQILRYVFGNNTNVRGDSYEDKLEVEYAAFKSTYFQQKPNGVFLFPALEGLALANNGINYDNVLPGACCVPLGGEVKSSSMSYVRSRINNPARSLWWWNRGKK